MRATSELQTSQIKLMSVEGSLFGNPPDEIWNSFLREIMVPVSSVSSDKIEDLVDGVVFSQCHQ